MNRCMDYEMQCVKTRDRSKISWKEVVDKELRSLH